MVVFATPERRATSSTLKPPTPLSLSSSRAAVRTACRERSIRLSTRVCRVDEVGVFRRPRDVLGAMGLPLSRTYATLRYRSVICPTTERMMSGGFRLDTHHH